jgi:hypothetical protein
VKKGYAYGPVEAAQVPAAAKVSGIMVRPKPNGSVRVILNLSAPKGRSVNDGIDKSEFKAGKGCLITKTDWASAYKHICVREADTDLQWFSWGGKFFKELCLIFGGVSSAGLFDDAAKLVLNLVCRMAGFPEHMVCQHLDDVCAVAAAGSDTLQRFDAAFQEIAAAVGMELAPRDDHDKSFGPCTAGVVFGVHYDTVDMGYPGGEAVQNMRPYRNSGGAGQFVGEGHAQAGGKLIHVKPLVPGGKFNIDKIMHAYKTAARTESLVTLSSACIRQLKFWHIFLQVCSGRVDIPRPPGQRCAGALNAYTDAGGGTSEAVGRGTGEVLGDWRYYIPWARRINAGGWKVDGKKVGHKLSALELVGPLVVVAAAHAICRGQTLQVCVDNSGSVEVYRRGYSRSCRLCTTIAKAMATVAAGIGCRLEVLKISRCTGAGAVMADHLSKARFKEFRNKAAEAGWPLRLEPARIPSVLLHWLDKPFPCDRLGGDILREIGMGAPVAGYSAHLGVQ